MTDAFIAKVVGQADGGNWTVTPQIIEHDGTLHPDITVSAVEGITPNANDFVLIITARNNLDNSEVQRYYSASEACGRIVGVVQTSSQFVFTGPAITLTAKRPRTQSVWPGLADHPGPERRINPWMSKPMAGSVPDPFFFSSRPTRTPARTKRKSRQDRL